MNELLGVSIIVLNYNYGRFLATAIDSALNQRHPLCEVIVVDDGSTDNSRAVIAHYGDRIRSVLRETNDGQISALNSAWPLARHPILIFLDADDVLLPHAAATVASRWTAETVKTQCPVVTIDKTGRRIGTVMPKYPPNLDTATLRRMLLRTGCCFLSPSSGNAYSRALLEAVKRDGGFELESLREFCMDIIMEGNAPFYGEVVTIYVPLACYRIHESNDNMFHVIDKARFEKMSRYLKLKLDYFAGRCRIWGLEFNPTAARNRSIWGLECRLVCGKLASSGDPLEDPVWRTLSRAVKAYTNATELPLLKRIIIAAWFISVAISPRVFARRLIALRFVITERPGWFKRFLTTLAERSATSPSSISEFRLPTRSSARTRTAEFPGNENNETRT
jgi:glycosyltransferase involved in cell wall biosynthesis